MVKRNYLGIAIIVLFISGCAKPLNSNLSAKKAPLRVTQQIEEKHITINVDSTKIYFNPDEQSIVITNAEKGDIFELKEVIGDWYKIVMFSGEYRYIKKSAARITEQKLEIPPEEKRKAIFNALYKIDGEIQQQTDKKYPVTDGKSMHENIEYSRILNDKYKLQICHKFGTNQSVCKKIISEGVKKRWRLEGVQGDLGKGKK